MSGPPPGIEPEAVTAWVAGRASGEVSPPLRFELIEGGRSNLTYLVSDAAGRRWVLRRPPLHGVLPSAHDMGRECRILGGLRDSAVPVPRTLGYEPDAEVTGAPFYVMEFVDGRVVRDLDGARTGLTAQERRAAGESIVDTLVALHEVDPDAVGLGDLGRKEDYLARQLRRWHGQLRTGQEQGGRPTPLFDEVHALLSADIPEQRGSAIVHGDYRLDNVILGGDARVIAVLDWELCTLGDPLGDVAILGAYWSDPGDAVVPLLSAPTMAAGFPRRAELLERYAAGSGRDLSDIGYYLAFANWRLGVILEGVYTRAMSGAYGEAERETWSGFGDLALGLGERALDLIRAR